jgi:GNAT superfamily N-acetyltransferase
VGDDAQVKHTSPLGGGHPGFREARQEDLPELRDIERRAGELFRELGMDAVADDEPPTISELLPYVRDGRAWVATNDSDVPVAYLLLDVVDDQGHIEQVSVDPSQSRRGLGRLLIEGAAAWAREHGLTSLTLTTFAEVPWNAPYYEALGFRRLSEQEITPGLDSIRRREAAHGLTAWPRVCMRRDLGASSGAL